MLKALYDLLSPAYDYYRLYVRALQSGADGFEVSPEGVPTARYTMPAMYFTGEQSAIPVEHLEFEPVVITGRVPKAKRAIAEAPQQPVRVITFTEPAVITATKPKAGALQRSAARFSTDPKSTILLKR